MVRSRDDSGSIRGGHSGALAAVAAPASIATVSIATVPMAGIGGGFAMDRDRTGLKTVQYKAFALNPFDLTADSESAIRNNSVLKVSDGLGVDLGGVANG